MEVWRGALFLPMVFKIMQKAGGQLVENFYESSCPNVEGIVKEMVFAKYMQENFSVPATLRLFFHDCFIEGCDASIMIASSNGDAEKDAADNLSLAGDGFDMVNRAKQAVEAACPGVVSCADILAIAARDVVVLACGPSFRVELGCRDGLISQASRVAGNIPEPSFKLTQLTTIFAKNNLSQTDLIALSGAHTLGVSNCSRIADRPYGFPPDPYLNKNYKGQLMLKCPLTAPTDGVVTMDSTPLTFDNLYYKRLEERKGLFISDEVLFVESASKPTVQNFADNPDNFSRAFIAGMVKLGRVGVKTGIQGEIRRNCAAFNS